MIFLTVGNELAFDRLVKAVDTWCKERQRSDVFGQLADLGPDNYRPKHFEWCSFLTPAEYNQKFNGAKGIVSHAGMGSIITALSMRKPILILPRRLALSETRNDHQFATAKRFQGRSGIFVADDESAVTQRLDDLVATLDTFHSEGVEAFADQSLIDALRAFIWRT